MHFVFLAIPQNDLSPLFRFKNMVSNVLTYLTPLGDLILRGWVAYAFFVSGWTKIQTWDSTLYLFNEEYHVPLLPPNVAAYLGTATELSFPVLLALGLFGRFSAALLFIFNIVAVISYPDLGAVGLEQHRVWAIMLLVCLLHGPGKLSADYGLKEILYKKCIGLKIQRILRLRK